MRKDALHCNNPAGVLLSCAINHSHAAAPDLLQNFVMTEAPLLVGHVCFREDIFERFAGRLAFGFESFAQETINAGPVIELRCGAARRTSYRILDDVRDEIRGPGCFVRHATDPSM